MFVISLTSEKLKKYLIIALVCALTTIGGVISVSRDSTPAAKVGGVNMRAGTAEERIAFFSQFGYEIAEDPLEVKEVIIPTEFDETYDKDAGFYPAWDGTAGEVPAADADDVS